MRSNPVMPLTKAEQDRVDDLNKNSSRKQVLDELTANLKIAIGIELATIPIYLYTYYSLVRNATSGEDIDPVQAYVNMAGAAIMSVSVEEMLHMSLGCNILFSMGVPPVLYQQAPKTYPAELPFHRKTGPRGPDGNREVKIPLGKLSFMQLWHFLQIEYPEKYDDPPQQRDWDTIGQFYSYIRCLISTKFITDADFRQGDAKKALQPEYYSPNNIDTVFPFSSLPKLESWKFDPWKPAPPGPMPKWATADPYLSGAKAAQFTDSDGSHAGPSQLMTVSSRQNAFEAITTIGDQGEGYSIPNVGSDEHDDRPSLTVPGDYELSHYFKFLVLQAQFKEYIGTKEELAKHPPPPPPQTPPVSDDVLKASGLVVNFPDNPTSASYPEKYRPIADFCSACFQYMLILSETVYLVPPEKQKLFFNEGLHRSMIWVLDKYARTIRNIPIGTSPSGDVIFMAPLFENVDLGPRATSFQSLISYYGVNAVAAAKQVPEGDPLFGVMQNVLYYINVATTLPDVGPYWTA